MMYCEALAFVAAQLHAAKCVQRYKCSEIAQALKETLCFLFVLFVISVNIRLISVPDLLPKRRLEHTTNWSVIWHNFDVIESSKRRKKEREERKNDNRIVNTKKIKKVLAREVQNKETPPARHCWT